MRLIALVSLSLIACSSGSGNPNGPDMKKASSCSGTVSGNQTVTFDTCGGLWEESSSGEAGVSLSITFPDGAKVGDFGITFSTSGDGKAVQLGTKESTGFIGGLDDRGYSPAESFQSFRTKDGTTLGSAEMNITSLDFEGSTASGSIWTPHGTFDGTFVPLPGSSGTGSLIVHATY